MSLAYSQLGTILLQSSGGYLTSPAVKRLPRLSCLSHKRLLRLHSPSPSLAHRYRLKLHCNHARRQLLCCSFNSRAAHVVQTEQTVATLPSICRMLPGLVSQMASLLVALALQGATADDACALLSSPNAQIPRTVDAALRRSIPAFNPAMKKLQMTMEDVAFLLRIPQRKPWGNMANDVQAALAAFEDRSLLLAGVPAGQEDAASDALNTLYSDIKKLQLAISTQQPNVVALRVADVLKGVATVELLEAPGLPFSIPKEYVDRPHLIGRAVVDLTIEKSDGSLSFLDTKNGGYTKDAHVQLTLDGYSAPVTSGNFVTNVLSGLYDNRPIQSSYASVIVLTRPGQERPPVPLEILPAGEFDPVYRSPLDVQGGEVPVLPLSISGAVSMTRLPGTDTYLSGDEWFVYKFDKQQAGLGGLAFDEGTFGVFGYVTEGLDVITHLQTGDVIVAARVVQGADKLVQ